MFETVTTAPPDSILGLNEAFKKDPSPNKINLGVGVYKDESGTTPVLQCVKTAEQFLLENESTKSYLAIDGDADYTLRAQQLLFGDAIDLGRVATIQTPGGTGALRVAGDFLHRLFPHARLWLSQPTWANHPNIFEAAGMSCHEYAYFDPANNGIDFAAMQRDLQQLRAGDVVLLHGCCHNPTGADPSVEQWQQIGQLLAEKHALPLVDFAYQGFSTGLEQDAEGLRGLLTSHDEILVCTSYSKNFGLYRERVGALMAVAKTPDRAETVMSQLKQTVRTNYSNPPAHGGAIVATILGSDELTSQWHSELAMMRDRINGMRTLLVQGLADAGIDRDFQFIARQRGMFSFSGLTREQVQRLRDEHAIYVVGSGRINVAGITNQNVKPLCQAIASVL